MKKCPAGWVTLFSHPIAGSPREGIRVRHVPRRRWKTLARRGGLHTRSGGVGRAVPRADRQEGHRREHVWGQLCRLGERGVGASVDDLHRAIDEMDRARIGNKLVRWRAKERCGAIENQLREIPMCADSACSTRNNAASTSDNSSTPEVPLPARASRSRSGPSSLRDAPPHARQTSPPFFAST